MNRLRSYVRRTLLQAARDYSPNNRRTPDSTRNALMDASRGTDTGWWTDLIYTADMLDMAHRYRNDIATALAEYRDATGEDYTYRENGTSRDEVPASFILFALLRCRKPYSFDQYRDTGATGIGDKADAALIGLRFAVEWYCGEVGRDLCPDL